MTEIKFTTRACPRCKSTEELLIPRLEFKQLSEGRMPIQKAAPSLTPAQRERLLTGFCDDCFKTITREG